MNIQCLLARHGGTKVELDGLEYHFQPLEDGAHVANVEDKSHIDRFLSIPEGYKLYHGSLTPTAAAVRVAPPGEDRKVAPVESRPEPLAGSSVHPQSFDINGATYSLETIVTQAFQASGMTPDQWNQMDEDDRHARIDMTLDDIAESKPADPPTEVDREALAQQFEAKFGKKPHHKMSAESIAAKLAE